MSILLIHQIFNISNSLMAYQYSLDSHCTTSMSLFPCGVQNMLIFFSLKEQRNKINKECHFIAEVFSTLFFKFNNNYNFIICNDHVWIIHNIDVPGPPGTPESTETSPTFISLTWTPPSTDGGSPVTHYILETKSGFSARWSKVTTERILETTFKVKQVKEDEEYQFRVIAVNKKGEGEPSQPTSPIKAAFPFSKWHKITDWRGRI